MKIVSWNMNRLGRSEASHKEAWEYIRHDLRADLALVQEASPPESFSAKVYSPIGEGRYNWGSAVVALRPGLELIPRPRVSLLDSLPAAVAKEELPDSHPGASAVADVLLNGQRLFTAVSLYAQWEMMPGGKSMYAGPRLHRMLSDLTGVLALAHRYPVVLAGDLNVTSQGAKSRENEAAAVFARLRAWRLVDCIALTRATRPRLSNCTCPEGDDCSHAQTFRRGSQTQGGITQLDYAFISESIASSLISCSVEGTAAAWRQSDHCPIILEVNEPMPRQVP
jgi:exonuclease III